MRDHRLPGCDKIGCRQGTPLKIEGGGEAVPRSPDDRKAVFDAAERGHMGIERNNVTPIIGGNQHYIRAGTPGLAEVNWMIHIEADHRSDDAKDGLIIWDNSVASDDAFARY